jgi:hypothetical protein
VQLTLAGKTLKPLAIEISAFSKDIETVVASAFAQALVGASNYGKESGCLAYVNLGGCIWTEGHPNEKNYCAGCIAVSYSEGAVDSIDAIAEASASPAPLTSSLGLCIGTVQNLTWCLWTLLPMVLAVLGSCMYA